MILHYLKVAFRNLWKYKIQNLIGILGLSVGFVCFVLTCHGFDQVLDRNGSIPNATHIYYFNTEEKASVENIRVQYPEIDAITPDKSSLTTLSATFPLKDKDISYFIDLWHVNPAFFDFFSFDFRYGNKEAIKSNTRSVVFFESYLKKININPKEIIGKEIATSNGALLVAAVLKDFSGRTDFSGQVGFVLSPDTKDPVSNYYVTLHSGDIYSFRNKIKQVSENEGGIKARIFPLAPDWTQNKFIYFLFMGLGSLVLITALFNYISFHSALFINRMKESALRKVHGSNRIHLFILFYTEIAIGFILVCLLSLLIIPPFVDMLNIWVKDELFNLDNLQGMILYYGLIGLVFAALLCLLPTMYINRTDIRTVIFGMSTTGGNMKGHNVLIFLQLFIMMFFLYTSIILGLQIRKFLPDFDRNNHAYKQTLIINAIMDHSRVESLLRDMKNTSSIENAFFTDFVFLDRYLTQEVMLNDTINAGATLSHVTPGLFDFFAIPLMEGELFGDFDERPLAIVNQCFIDSYLKDADPMGSIIRHKEKYYRIIGVVGNSPFIDKKHNAKEKDACFPVVYFPAYEYFGTHFYVLSVPNAKNIEKTLEEILRNYIPEENGYTITTLKEIIDTAIDGPTRVFNICVLLLIVSIIIGLLSVYSAIAMNTEKRRREVAIRKINGARIKDIIRLFGRKYFILWTIVWLLGCPIVYLAIRYIPEFPRDFGTYLGIILLVYLSVLALIFLTIISRILDVARLNPTETLKSN